MKPCLSWLLVVAALASCVGAGDGVSRPYEGYLPGATPNGILAVLVRHAATGEPIAGVEVVAYKEDVRPVSIDAPLVGKATTDEHGLAWLRVSKDAGHWVFRRPDLAPLYVRGNPATTVELRLGRAATGRLVDAFGNPASGVRLAVVGNCVHGPTLRQATTDEDGVFRFGPLDFESSYPALLRCREFRLSDRMWLDQDELFVLGDGVPLFAGDRGVVIHGRITRRDGTPLPDCVVRGPLPDQVAPTNAHGMFRLPGLRPFDEVRLFHADWLEGRVPFFRMNGVSDTELHIKFPPIAEQDVVAFPIRLVDADSREPLVGLPVRLVNAVTGIVYFGTTSGDKAYAPRGTVLLTVPSGSYHMYVGNSLSRYARFATSQGPRRVLGLEVNNRRVPLVVPCVASTVVSKVEFVDVPEQVRVTLIANDSARSSRFPRSLAQGGPVPEEGSLSIRVQSAGLTIVEKLGHVRDGARHGRVRWPRPKRIRFVLPKAWRDVGIAALDGAAFEEHLSEGRVVVSTHATGRLRFLVMGHSKERGSVASTVSVAVPLEPGAEVLVKVPAVQPRMIQVLLADGSPARGAIELENGDAPENLDNQGRAVSSSFLGGTTLLIQQPGYVNLRVRLAGDGPYVLRYGPCTLKVEITAASGKWLRGVFYLDGTLYPVDGSLTLRGLGPGRHVLIGSTPNHIGMVWKINLRANETKRIRMRLRSRSEAR